MKKILAFVLALVMVLGMATVVSATDTLDEATMVDPSIAYNKAHPDKVNATTATVTVEKWVQTAAENYAILKLTIDGAYDHVTVSTDDGLASGANTETANIGADGKFKVVLTEDTTKLFVSVYTTEFKSYTVTAGDVGMTAIDADGEDDGYTLKLGDKYWKTSETAGTYKNVQTLLYNVTLTAPESTDIVIAEEIYKAVKAAYEGKSDTVTINLDEIDNVVTAEEWKFMTHSYGDDVTFVNEDGDELDTTWYKGYKYIETNFKFVQAGTYGPTYFYLDAADLSYSFAEDVDFSMDNGLSYKGLTEAEVLAAIRKLTGDTKNPYTFGFVVPIDDLPTMTVSYVINQQWINVYGHKDLAIWAYTQENVKCEACGQKHDEFKTIEGTTLDAVTQTQRIEFETNEFYSTIVLSKTAAASAATDTAKADENPNTGANDIVNVAIVFSVISLAAAGAFVFSKQR